MQARLLALVYGYVYKWIRNVTAGVTKQAGTAPGLTVWVQDCPACLSLLCPQLQGWIVASVKNYHFLWLF